MHILKPALVLALVGIAASFPTSTADDASPHLVPIPDLDPHTIAALKALGKTPRDLRLPGSVPTPKIKPGTDILPGIDHIIMLMFENHSLDNIWGTLDRPDVDGFTIDRRTGKPIATQKYANGSIQHAYIMPKTCTSSSNGPTQNWMNSHLQYNNGSLDGFVTAGIEKPVAMGYFTAEQLPFMHSLGKTFPISDRFFCSVLGQTWPNRMYLISGTSRGVVNTGSGTTGLIPPAGTIFDTLDKFNISWNNYVSGFPDGHPIIRQLPTINLYNLTDQNATATKHGRTFEQFFIDAAAGTLPSFSLLDPNYTIQSQENPQNLVVGESLMYDVVHALGASPVWNSSLLIINYDEHGGYYDHVVPPPALAPDEVEPNPPAGQLQYEGYRRYGFRVPAVVVSPYARKNYVSHVVHDQTSILAFLEYKWNLPALTMRDANANNMLDFIDLDALRKRRMTFPSMSALRLSLPGNTTEALACTPADPGVVPPVGSVESPRNDTSGHGKPE